MKPRFSNQKNRALARFEVLVSVLLTTFLIFLFLAMFLPVREAARRRDDRITCVNNLKQLSLAFRIWEGDHGNEYPMSVSVTNRGAMELIATGNVAACFRVMSNELSTPKILFCPADVDHRCATNFENDFNNSHISYFLSLDASEMYPQMILSGDDNLAIGNPMNKSPRPMDGPAAGEVPVKPGILELPSNVPISWTLERHGGVGNISFADGSVQEVSENGLQTALQYSIQGTPVGTNGLAIP